MYLRPYGDGTLRIDMGATTLIHSGRLLPEIRYPCAQIFIEPFGMQHAGDLINARPAG